ncbi:MAG: porin, partial [Polyangiaceae bacterium]
ASKVTIGGYVETYYSYDFNNPSNRLTNYRAFDNRHNAITLQNLVLDVAWEFGTVYARGALQAGQVGETYYDLSEPSQAGSAGAGPSGADVFKHIQQAYLGWAPTKRLHLEAGIFLSPIGPESMPTHENWTWSHTNLFFGLPFYHSGARVSYDVAPTQNVRFGIYNGWNNVIDNNDEKSIALEYSFTPSDALAFGVQYFGGVERPAGAPEGRAWRHLLDASAKVKLTKRFAFLADVDGGLEPNYFGKSAWISGILGARFRAASWLYFAGRQTIFAERRASRAGEIAAPIAIPTPWMSGTTATIDFRPVDHLSAKLEYRHDLADGSIYYRSVVAGDGSAANPFVGNARSQDTLTLGLTAWF